MSVDIALNRAAGVRAGRVDAPARAATIIGLGANLDDPVRQLRAACAMIRDTVDVAAVSDVYRTEPVGFLEQPDFYNLVLRGVTDATIYDLHECARAIEATLGRRRGRPNAPRVIDVDLLTYGELCLRSDELTLPHPRMHLRSFVLVPLAEIAPDWRHPVLGRTAAECLVHLRRPSRVTHWGPLADVDSR